MLIEKLLDLIVLMEDMFKVIIIYLNLGLVLYLDLHVFCDNAEVKCNARVGNNCVIYGDAIISGKYIRGIVPEVGGFSVITGNAFLFCNIKIEGYSVLDGDVSINGNCHN